MKEHIPNSKPMKAKAEKIKNNRAVRRIEATFSRYFSGLVKINTKKIFKKAQCHLE